jgi:hypothetical protein
LLNLKYWYTIKHRTKFHSMIERKNNDLPIIRGTFKTCRQSI